MNPNLEAIRHRIEHEDNLLNQRLSWLVGSQSFLVTAFAILLNGVQQEAQMTPFAHARHLLIALLPWVSLACITLLWLTVAGAVWSMMRLRAAAAAVTGPTDPPVHSPAPIRRLGLAAPVAIPAVFLVLWLALLHALRP
jgi:heme/copper-type cytochrome/quinol oxidase subunit 2